MKTRHRSRWRVILRSAAIAIVLSCPAAAFQSPVRPEPRLPGAVTKPPEWVGADAPFDVKAFFAAPPPEQNAAPLYLDALFEFDPNLAECFPADAETSRRKIVAGRRNRTIEELDRASRTDRTTVSDQAIDDLVAELKPALRKIRIAQSRPRCVFEGSFDLIPLMPQVGASRRLSRLIVMKVRRDVDRGDVEDSLADIEMILRLARDLRPRGSMVNQLVANLLIFDATYQMGPALLASSAFRDRHARRLLDVLRRHEAAEINGYQQAMRHEYLMARKMLPEVRKEPRKIGQTVFGDAPAIEKLRKDILKEPGKARQAVGDFLARRDDDEVGERFGRLLEQELRTKPAVYGAVNDRLDAYVRDALAFDGPFARWPGGSLDPARVEDGTLYSMVVRAMVPPARAAAEGQARGELLPRAAQCLVALWLWKQESKGPPTDLEAVVKAAGLPAIPIDPYSGKPLRMAIIDGEPVVYSIGKDGRDDGGRIDSNGDRKPGDQTFRLPAVAKPKS